MLAWRDGGDGPAVVAARVGRWLGFDEDCLRVVILPDHDVNGLEIVVPIGDGIGDLPSGGRAFGAILDVFFLQGFEADDLIANSYVIDEGRGHRRFGIFIEGDIDMQYLMPF